MPGERASLCSGPERLTDPDFVGPRREHILERRSEHPALSTFPTGPISAHPTSSGMACGEQSPQTPHQHGKNSQQSAQTPSGHGENSQRSAQTPPGHGENGQRSAQTPLWHGDRSHSKLCALAQGQQSPQTPLWHGDRHHSKLCISLNQCLEVISESSREQGRPQAPCAEWVTTSCAGSHFPMLSRCLLCLLNSPISGSPRTSLLPPPTSSPSKLQPGNLAAAPPQTQPCILMDPSKKPQVDLAS